MKRITRVLLTALFLSLIFQNKMFSQIENPLNSVECPVNKEINICAPVSVAPSNLKDLINSNDEDILGLLNFQVEDFIDIQDDFTTKTFDYIISDNAGNQLTCQTKYHIANQFLHAPKIISPNTICQQDLWSSIKIGSKKYKIYADNNGTKGSELSTCNTPNLICSTSDLGVDTAIPNKHSFWVTKFFTFPDGTICESQAAPFCVDIETKPVAELSTQNQTIVIGEHMPLMDIVTTNTNGFWSGENISYQQNNEGESIPYFSSNTSSVYTLYYTVKNEHCSSSYSLEVVVVNDYVFDCTYEENSEANDGFISEIEYTIMDECYDNRLTSKSEIEQNLIGGWELIGYGTFWNPNVTMPCVHLEITENEIINTIRNKTLDTTFIYTWQIKEYNHSNRNYFKLETEPNHLSQTYVFCSDYMFYNLVPADLSMYLFQKMK